MHCSLLADGVILNEMYRIRSNFVKKEKIRISIGTWNINGDKNPALEDQYPSILDAWMLNGPQNILGKDRKDGCIPTMGTHLKRIERLHRIDFSGFVSEDYTKGMPDILAIGFQEICDLTATNMVWQR